MHTFFYEKDGDCYSFFTTQNVTVYVGMRIFYQQENTKSQHLRGTNNICLLVEKIDMIFIEPNLNYCDLENSVEKIKYDVHCKVVPLAH